MHQLVLVSRALAKMLDGTDAARLRTHAQAVEDLLSRLDLERKKKRPD